MMKSVNVSPLIDYSQHCQSLILDQLLTDDIPRVVVDIGAHDGLHGSNSRALLESGWRAVMVEPIPDVFSQLRQNCGHFHNATLVPAACSNVKGIATIRVGKDGACGQMSSLSTDPIILANVTEESFEVATTTLSDLISGHAIPWDFGVLLIDTEGWDFTVLKTLEGSQVRPRIIVTEEFAANDHEKYAFLAKLGYRFAGVWSSDSFWVSETHDVDVTALRIPIIRLPDDWVPAALREEGGRAWVDSDPHARGCVVGWACLEGERLMEPNAAVSLQRVNSPQKYCFRAWRIPRPDVAQYFKSPDRLMSGYRAPIDVPGGKYEVRVIQFGTQFYADDSAGRVFVQDGQVQRVES
jgi:FkbM family methyltransferase